MLDFHFIPLSRGMFPDLEISRGGLRKLVHDDAAARIRTWEPLRDETLNLAPFPCLATAATLGTHEM